jgi:UDP-N-acetyl-D-glucosamine dehydrogenase
MHADLLVVGLGYVGLPLAREASLAGLTVVGFDINVALVAGLNTGGFHMADIPDADVAAMIRHGFRGRLTGSNVDVI